MAKPAETSLSKLLSVCGVASRRKSTELVRQGKVKVNGKTVLEPGFKVNDADTVLYDGKKLKMSEKLYIMLNKPRGCVCTSDDPHAQHKAIDLIKLPPDKTGIRLFSAGRLDKDSEGLLIFTSDGDYAETIMHPRYGILKRYLVKTDVEITAANLEKIRKGIRDDNEFLRPEKILQNNACTYTFILNEGKKREIRRLVKAAGAKVRSLKRVSLGCLELGGLKPGCWRFLGPGEVEASGKNPQEAR